MRFLVACAALSFAPAAAAAVFATIIFSQGGQAANAASGLGSADGGFARIGNSNVTGGGSIVGQAGQVVHSFADALSGAGLQLTGIGGALGVAVFSAETSSPAPPGFSASTTRPSAPLFRRPAARSLAYGLLRARVGDLSGPTA